MKTQCPSSVFWCFTLSNYGMNWKGVAIRVASQHQGAVIVTSVCETTEEESRRFGQNQNVFSENNPERCSGNSLLDIQPFNSNQTFESPKKSFSTGRLLTQQRENVILGFVSRTATVSQ